MAQQSEKLKGRKVLLGISGGIAAYKAADLASKLTGAGALVRTIMTESACKLIAPLTLESVTGQPVYTNMWQGPEDFKIGHIQMAEWVDIVAVAPATADLIAKVANGICDDLLTTTLCACWDRSVLLAPAMNSRMWANPVVQRNLAVVQEQLKFKTVGPETGRLACGTEGIGRMTEVPAIIEAIEKLL
jgi:phosphopantothenoylcysteine decarboxylase/phosphopantothenate--cysteine ligase